MAVDETQKKSTIREYYEALLIAVIFVNFARIFAFQAFKIPTGSMEDNLKVGDHIIVNKFIYGPGPNVKGFLPLRDIKRGDIIVFRYPLQPDTDFVKRVIGMPGDVVEVRDKVVSVNGKALTEPYVIHDDPQVYPLQPALPEPYRSRDQFGPFSVPQGQYFAMGDNRTNSYDSRFWGCVPRNDIIGTPVMIYMSLAVTPQAWEPGQIRERFLAYASALLHPGLVRWKRLFRTF